MPLYLLLLGMVVVLFLWFFPAWQVYRTQGLDKTKAETCLGLINDSRQTWAQVLAGAFFLVTAYFTNASLTLARATAEDSATNANKNLEIANKNLDFAQKGQITDRFTKAVDQLGATEDNKPANLPRRIGAIYALEGIAHDSSQYHWPSMEVLSAYVRLNANWHGIRQDGVPYPEDLQSVLTVMGRRDNRQSERGQIDLNNSDLSGADLSGLHLEDTYLYGAHLEGVYMAGCHLDKAVLMEAHFAVLDKAHPDRHATLDDCTLTDCDLRHATLDNCTLTGCDLTNADLRDTDLTKCSITQKQLDSAYTNTGTKVAPPLHVTPRSPSGS